MFEHILVYLLTLVSGSFDQQSHLLRPCVIKSENILGWERLRRLPGPGTSQRRVL